MAHVDKLKDLVYTQKRTVSIRDICYSLNVHVSEARRILEDFVADENKKDDSKLEVTYIVSGSGLDSTEDFKVHKLTYAKAEELDEVKKGFASINSCKVYSVSLKDHETTIGDIENSLLLDRDDLLKKQKLTYIVNDDIQFRPDRLERFKLISGIPVNESNVDVKTEVKTEKKESAKESKVDVKKETKGSNKRSTNRRNTSNNKKQSKLSSFGSKKVEKTNSPDSKFSLENTPDPFSEEEEKDEEEDMEVEPSPPSPPSPVKVKIEPEDEKPKRRMDDSEDEVKEVKKSKKESKKRKRVRVHDSDEEDEEAMALRILAGEDGNSNQSNGGKASLDSTKMEEPEPESEPEEKPTKKLRKKSKPSQPMKTELVEETYTDDEGYSVTRMVKKLVPVDENEEKKAEVNENGNVKKEANEKAVKVKTEKPVNKKQKMEEDEDEDLKPKGKKQSKAAQAKKGLVSITSFFKPAAKV